MENQERHTFTVNGVSFDMIRVEGGTFMMGATSKQDSYAKDNEKPVHSVTLSSFSIGETEVTQKLWNAIMNESITQIASDPYWPICGSGSNYPMYYISWWDCQEFISKLNNLLSCQLGGMRFRLPTEAEWEYAARGGNKSRGYKYSGSNNLKDVAWYYQNSSSTRPVKQKLANELGLYDMNGNVWEWCEDWYSDYSSSSQTNPTGPSYGANRVIRGGCWFEDANQFSSLKRHHLDPDYSGYDVGFRLVLSDETTTNKKYNDLSSREIFTVNGVSFNMIRVEGGTFMMGALPNDNEAFNNEKPRHSVTLSSFYIGETVVTKALWTVVMDPTSSEFINNNPWPVDDVSWDDCQEFIRKLNILTGRKFRLPTEAEWEFAARGGNKSHGYKYSGSQYNGNNNIEHFDNFAWYFRNSGERYFDDFYTYDEEFYDDWFDENILRENNCKTHIVKSKFANELGLYDMSGNVWEWCSDWYGDYSSSSQTNPKGPFSGSARVCRGGCWKSITMMCRTSMRISRSPDIQYDDLGFRLVLSE